MNTVPADDAGLAAATSVLMCGGVVVIPTDTVYGLAAHPDFPDAVERLYTIKGREEKKPIALLASDSEAAERFGAIFPPQAKSLATTHWPGPLTLVLPITESPLRASQMRGNPEGFRVPDHGWTRRLIAACGGVLRVTSANLSGRRPATDAPEALASVGLSADLVIDDGISPGGVASTVVRVSQDNTLTILRQGALTL